jgi:hypothetical protein
MFVIGFVCTALCLGATSSFDNTTDKSTLIFLSSLVPFRPAQEDVLADIPFL